MPNENIISTYIDPASQTARKTEANQSIPTTSWDNGMNASSNMCGVGIGTQTDLGESGQWTLTDQKGEARTPQNSQLIGTAEQPVSIVTNPADGSGEVTVAGAATLNTLSEGWVSE